MVGKRSKPLQGYNRDMEYWLATSPWPGVILWIILYVSDYYLTIYSARGFREIGHFQFEDSFELTPQFQKDINALKPVSKLHMFLLLEVAVHLRHLRNISLIRECRKNGGVQGQISYRKWFTYRISASEFYTFSVLFLLNAILQ